MAKVEAIKEKEVKTKVSVYTLEQLTTSDKFRADRDILSALLVKDKQYAKEEINKIIDDFKKKPIKEQVNKRRG